MVGLAMVLRDARDWLLLVLRLCARRRRGRQPLALFWEMKLALWWGRVALVCVPARAV